jgi:hypothetical protein
VTREQKGTFQQLNAPAQYLYSLSMRKKIIRPDSACSCRKYEMLLASLSVLSQNARQQHVEVCYR